MPDTRRFRQRIEFDDIVDVSSIGTLKINDVTVTASAADLNRTSAAGAYSTDLALQTLAVADLNKFHFLSATVEFATTLPAVSAAAGYWVTFIVAAAPSSASYTVVTAASENKIKGHILTSQDAGGSSDFEVTGGDTITFVDSKAVAGDRVDMVCDGLFWYVRASCTAFDAVTITGT